MAKQWMLRRRETDIECTYQILSANSSSPGGSPLYQNSPMRERSYRPRQRPRANSGVAPVGSFDNIPPPPK